MIRVYVYKVYPSTYFDRRIRIQVEDSNLLYNLAFMSQLQRICKKSEPGIIASNKSKKSWESYFKNNFKIIKMLWLVFYKFVIKIDLIANGPTA